MCDQDGKKLGNEGHVLLHIIPAPNHQQTYNNRDQYFHCSIELSLS